MGAIATNVVTYLDFAKRLDESGKVEKSVIEILTQMNEILDDMAIVEGNLPTGHKTTIRTGLPSVTWRLLNYGVQPSKSATAQITDVCGMLEAYAEVDKSLADLNGNTAAWRLSEEKPFLEAMNIEMAATLFYGDTAVNPEKFLGLRQRYFASTGSASSANVIKAGGASTDNSSLWLVVWGPETVHAIYPKGSKAGVFAEDKGQQTLFDSATPPGRYEGYRSHYKWDLGLTVRDWRYVVRICNIAKSTLTTASDTSDTSANLVKFMIQALNMIPNIKAGRAAWYCNALVKTYLEIKLANIGKLITSMNDLGNPNAGTVYAFGIPVRRVDQLTEAETLVS